MTLTFALLLLRRSEVQSFNAGCATWQSDAGYLHVSSLHIDKGADTHLLIMFGYGGQYAGIQTHLQTA